MPHLHAHQWGHKTKGIWGILVAICVVYGGFAIAAGLGLAETGKTRALPLPFQIHALAGGLALITGIIQFNPTLRAGLIQAHRWVGRTYVISACLAAVAAVLNAAFFDVSWAARLSFFLLGLAWLSCTLQAYRVIRQRNIPLHREWMVRSFFLAFFFVTFSLWVPLLAASSQGNDAAYAIAVTISWVPNLLCAELWIRKTRRPASQTPV